jgi:hypothetical protein
LARKAPEQALCHNPNTYRRSGVPRPLSLFLGALAASSFQDLLVGSGAAISLSSSNFLNQVVDFFGTDIAADNQAAAPALGVAPRHVLARLTTS